VGTARKYKVWRTGYVLEQFQLLCCPHWDLFKNKSSFFEGLGLNRLLKHILTESLLALIKPFIWVFEGKI